MSQLPEDKDIIEIARQIVEQRGEIWETILNDCQEIVDTGECVGMNENTITV